jgi:HK97 gp10 family phage protein
VRILHSWRQKELIARVSGELVQNMDRACQFAAEVARATAPVRTGILRSEIAYVVSARGQMVEGVVGVKRGRAFYAWFVERGTSKMAAQPFLRPAVFGNAARIVRIIAGGE